MFETLQALPPDPILGLLAAFREDPNPAKIDLGVGVYMTEEGTTPIMAAVKAAEQRRLELEDTKAYIGPAGNAGFNRAMQTLLFGADSSLPDTGRLVTLQTPGGCGALRVGAELIQRARPGATLWVSDPTWANHAPLLGHAGLSIREYPYYDYASGGLRFEAMLETLRGAGPGDLVLLHGSCHNPSGADLNDAQWQAVTELALERGFTPYIDVAYQGLGRGLDEDAAGLRWMAERVPEMIIASSCSKTFGLYRERTGALTLLAQTAEQAQTAATQAFNIVRGIYSMPPAHGAALVDIILSDAGLTAQWREELTGIRNRINSLRQLFVDQLAQRGAGERFAFIARQYGMFSFLGLSEAQVEALRRDYSLYMMRSSRINIAGLSQANIGRVCDAVVAVL